jgi:hypothetical protein
LLVKKKDDKKTGRRNNVLCEILDGNYKRRPTTDGGKKTIEDTNIRNEERCVHSITLICQYMNMNGYVTNSIQRICN